LKQYFHEIRALIAQDDRRQVVKHFSYPVELNIGGTKVTIKDETEMLGSYDDRTSVKMLLGAVEEQKVEDLFVNAMGVMVGDGQLWFGVTDAGRILSSFPLTRDMR
jgi:hypothetical protein